MRKCSGTVEHVQALAVAERAAQPLNALEISKWQTIRRRLASIEN
jgi:hypothetical protein